MSYRILAPYTRWQLGPYHLEAYRHQDLETIRLWRNAQIAVLRQPAPLTPEDQQRYWATHIEPSFQQDQPKIMLFSFLHQGQPIGYGGLTNTDWQARRTELSFLAATERTAEQNPQQYAVDFGAFLTLTKYMVFQRLGLHRLFTETYDIRPLHLQLLEAAGLQPEGRLRHHAWANNRHVDSLLHGILSTDPAAQPPANGSLLES